MTEDENPFERWGIDPSDGPAAITERMRELAADAPDEATRKTIRAAWEELTMHPARRFRAAVTAHPDSHGVGDQDAPVPPVRPRPRSQALELSDLVLRPSVLAALDLRDVADRDLPDVDPEHDPVFSGLEKW